MYVNVLDNNLYAHTYIGAEQEFIETGVQVYIYNICVCGWRGGGG